MITASLQKTSCPSASWTNERTFIETELLAYIRNYIATSILEGIDDSSWNAHLEQLKALQYDAWLQWYQDYLDGKF